MTTTRTLLIVLVLVALATQGWARRIPHGKEHKQKHREHKERRWCRSKWCGGLQCPQFRVEKECDEYDIRTYRKSCWVVTEAQDEKYEIAYLKATARLRMYLDGQNSDSELLRHTTPTVSELRPNEDGATTSKNYTFAMYLPDKYQGRHGRRAPAPLDPTLRIEKWEKDTLFVRSFGGFATEATILNQMNELTNMLEDDDRDYQDESVWVAVYHPPTRLTDRHNEILMEVAPRKCTKST